MMMASMLALVLGCAHSGAALGGGRAAADVELQYTRAPGTQVRQRVLVDGVALAGVPEEIAVGGPHRAVYGVRLPAGEHEVRVLVRFAEDTTPAAEPGSVVTGGMVGPVGAEMPILTAVPADAPPASQRTTATCEATERVTVDAAARYVVRFTFVEDGQCALRVEAAE